MENKNIIYLDNAATTIPSKEVVALYNEIELNHFGNSGSNHAIGYDAMNYLNKARESILNSFGVKGYKVYFVSSSTEANNLAIKGVARKYASRGKHLITSNIEHPSVLESFRQLEKEGFEVTYLKVNSNGIIEPKVLEEAIRKDTIFVSIMGTNNEIGSINPIKELSKITHKYPKIIFHVDTTQDVGKTNLDYSDADIFVVSGHKIHGLKGSGAVIAKSTIEFESLLSGGVQEFGVRAGTISVSLACSLAKAVKNAFPVKNLQEKRSFLVENLKKIPGILLNSNEKCSPSITNISLTEKKAAVVVEGLSNKGIFVSSISACHSKGESFSYVVKALGRDDKLSHNTIRISITEETTIEELEIFIKELKNLLETIK